MNTPHYPNWHEQQEMLQNRLRKNQRRLRDWALQRDITCYRLYDRDITEIPLAIDRYGDYVHIAEYHSKHHHSEEQHKSWANAMIEATAAELQVPTEAIFFKLRQRQKGKAQYERLGSSGQRVAVHEGGLRFWVNLSDYLDTGLFLDHRETRHIVQTEAAARRVLNLFAYTGSFTIYAAAGDACQTTSVDMSRTYLRWTRDNLELNGLWSRNHRLIHSDVFAFLKEPRRQTEAYDMIILDPPTFSNSKRMSGNFDIQRDHLWLLQNTIDLLSPNGILYFSTNFRKFQFAETSLHRVAITDISAQTIPTDFRNSLIHRCWRMIKT
jgi:23S rRNA G2069 N7-methylase RlmK/C1962 C5-methylase RlmI